MECVLLHTLSQAAPSNNRGLSAGESASRLWQTNRANVVGKRHWTVQSQYGQVVVLQRASGKGKSALNQFGN